MMGNEGSRTLSSKTLNPKPVKAFVFRGSFAKEEVLNMRARRSRPEGNPEYEKPKYPQFRTNGLIFSI